MRPGRIEIEIEELSLAGLPSAFEGEEFGTVLRLELERLAAECPPPLDVLSRAVDELSVETKFTTDSTTLARRVAQALYGGFNR